MWHNRCMIEITYLQMILFITAAWIIVRAAVAIKQKTLSFKRELLLLLVYICFVVIARFVYFGFHLVDGKIATLKIDISKITLNDFNLIPFYFVFDRYGGWLMNVIGNIAMFIPVGIVWPLCFPRLNNFLKATLAGAGFSLFIELTQILCFERYTDIDDLILNTAGAAIGAFIYFAVAKALNGRPCKRS